VRKAVGQRLLVIVVRHLEIARNEILDLGPVFQFLDALFERCHAILHTLTFLAYSRSPVNT
jgi:hypothetical protein